MKFTRALACTCLVPFPTPGETTCCCFFRLLISFFSAQKKIFLARCTCTAHSGAKKAHDWAVDQLADLFRTPHKVKTQQVVKRRGSSLWRHRVNGISDRYGRPGNDAAADKIRKYRADYNNNPPSVVSFMPAIASTSGRLHSEFIRLLFLQTHRETDRFFAVSGVQSAQFDRGFFHSHLNLTVTPHTRKLLVY